MPFLTTAKKKLSYSLYYRILIHFFLSGFAFNSIAQPVVNVYVWGGEIPLKIIHQFEKESGINVNFSSYDSNEIMYAKLKASRKQIYDVIMPSGYFVERMKRNHLLSKLDSKKLPNIKNIDRLFTKNQYDPGNQYSIPLHWGVTGLFYTDQRVKKPPKAWRDFWQKRWKRQLLMLDDAREVFSIGLMSLGYLPNDESPEHIKEAYHALLKLVPNIKMFASDNVQAIIIDEDAIAGATWNGDAYKAHQENMSIHFIYPNDGYVIWIDCLAIPKNAPHLEEAYQFINYILKPNIGAQIALKEGHASTNVAAKKLLPKRIRNNPSIYPSKEVFERGYFQRTVSDQTISLYNQYWEKLKLSF